MTKVLLDGSGLHASGKAADPSHDGDLRGRKERSIAVVEVVISGVLDERLLADVVCCPCTGCKPVPKIECDGRGKLRVSFVPPVWRHFLEGCWLRLGARENMREKAKQEAASATELSEEESQIEEKEKSRKHASWRN